MHRIYELLHDKTNKNDLCAQRRLRTAWAFTQSDQSSLYAQWVAKDPRFLHVDKKVSNQTGCMPRPICVFAGRTLVIFVVLSCIMYNECSDHMTVKA